MRTQTTRPSSVVPVTDPDEEAESHAAAEVVASVPVAGLAVPLQRKVIVGGVNDPAEAEADRVARSVVAALRRSSDGHTDGPGCSHCAGEPVRRASIGTLRRHGAADGHEHTPAIGLAGGDVDTATEAVLNASAGNGNALPDGLQRSIGAALGADLSGIRIHTGSQAAGLNRGMSALAFTRGRDIYFRDGLPDVSRDDGLHLLAHELTHTVQQGSAPRVDFAGAVGVQRVASGQVIHRHAAFEHYLLGQFQPKDLAKIPEVRKIKDNKGQLAHVESGKGGGLQEKGDDEKTRSEVEHLIDQEMQRLMSFADNPEALDSRKGDKGKVTEVDGKWNVPIVVLPCKDGEIVVSYSEMNTMPDLFGNPEAIAITPKANVLALLQGVRQQLYIELSKLRAELFGAANNNLYRANSIDADFQGAKGPRSQEASEVGEKAIGAYEKRTEMEVNTQSQGNQNPHEEYFAALERNACHFAPESWSQWEGYYRKAVKLARDSWFTERKARFEGDNPAKQAELKELAKDLANQALVQNSFGEHYLQDSFAAGHLIDKTKVMQYFTLWLQKSGKGLGSGETATQQWNMTVHAAKQPLKSNPQALHDKGVRQQLGSGKAAAKEIGMESSPDISLMMRWRALVKAKPNLRTLTPAQAGPQFGMPAQAAERNMRSLVQKGFADEAKGKFELKKSQAQTVDPYKSQGVVGWLTSAAMATNPYTATKGTNPDGAGALSDKEVAEAEGEFNVASYNALMSNAYIQASTKFFHDKFCKEGLEVISGTGEELGRIYGDANMLNAGGQKGLKYAADTSLQSRSSIFDIIAGNGDTYPTADIAKRFPKQVKLDGTFLPIIDFNEALRKKGEAGWFAEAQSNGALVVYKAKNGISSAGALDVAKLVGPLDAQPF